MKWQIHSANIAEGIKLDLFFADRENWGLIYAMRTGSADYSHKVLATEWVKNGYKSEGGYLHSNGERVTIPEEEDLFKLIGLSYLAPELRNF